MRETQSARLELFRHFLERLFDSEFFSSPGQLKVLLGGLIAILASLGGLLTNVYYRKYLVLQQFDTPEPFQHALLADIVFLVTFVMTTMGIFTTVQWTSLFPSLRDYLALAGLPLRMRQIFVAKISALAALALAVLLALTVFPSFMFPAVIRGKYLDSTVFQIPALFVSCFLAGIFVFLALVTVEGVLLNVTPVRHFPKVSLAVQGLLIAALLGSFPFLLSIPNLQPYVDQRPEWILWAPPLWFVAIHQVMTGNREPIAVALADRAFLAAGISFGTALVSYWWSYRKHRRRILEELSTESTGSRAWIDTLLHRLIPSPRRMAVFAFIGKTFRRSEQHRLILTGFAAIALAISVEGFLGISQTSRVAFRQAAVAIPLASSLFVVAGLRYLFRLPVELRANWVFRMEAENPLELLGGVEAFLAYAALIPLAAIALLLEVVLIGPRSGIAAATLCVLASALLIEVVLFSFQRIPFTSSYLPGRRPLIDVVIGYTLAAVVYVTSLSGLIAWCSAGWARSLVLAVLFTLTWSWLRRTRHAQREIHHLEFEELPEPVVETLSIEKD